MRALRLAPVLVLLLLGLLLALGTEHLLLRLEPSDVGRDRIGLLRLLALRPLLLEGDREADVRRGVDRALGILTGQLKRTLQLLGVARVADLNRSHVRLRSDL